MSIEHSTTIAYGFLIKPGTEANKLLQEKYSDDGLDINNFGLAPDVFAKEFPGLVADASNDSWSGASQGLIVYAGSSVIHMNTGSIMEVKAVSLAGLIAPDEEIARLVDFQHQYGLEDNMDWVAWNSIY